MAKEDERIEGLNEEDLNEEELEELKETDKKNNPEEKAAQKSSAKQTQKPQSPQKKEEEQTQTAKRRFATFTQPQRVGIIDAESGELVGEGETAVLDALANIIERLERLESNIGTMVGN